MKIIAQLFSFLFLLFFILFISCTKDPAGPDISDELKPHGSITGYIYSLLDNQPVKDVLVSVNADSARIGTSDATGKFTVGRVTSGTYTLRFIHRDYEDNPSHTVTVEHGMDDTLSDTVRLSYAYYTLKGNVVFNVTPVPGAGVAVSGTPYSTLTDLNGSFLLTMIPCRLNTIKLICAKTGFGYGVDSSIICIPNDTTDVGSIYLLSGGATVYGTVYDTSGNPIKDAYVVAAVGGGLTDTTDIEGKYKLENVPCNEKVTIYVPPTDKFYGSSIGFLLKEGTEAQIDIYLRTISDTTDISKVSLYTDDMIVNESDITANLIAFPETGINTVIDTFYWNIGAAAPKKQYITYDPECLVLVDTLKKYAGYFKGQKLETAVEVFAKTTDGYTSNSSYFIVMIHTNQPVVTAGASLHKDSTAKDAVTVEKNRGVWFKAKATDPFGGIDSITWNFGDGCTKVFSDTFPNFAYFYNAIDTFHAVVRAFDTDGNTDSDTVVVRVIPPQITAPQLISPADLDTVFINPGDSVSLTWHKKQESNLTYTVYMEYRSTYPTDILGTALQDTVLIVPVTVGTAYYWRVEAIAATSDASSAVWCFTVAQKQVNNNAPQFDTSYTMRDSVEAGKIYTDTLRASDIDNDPMIFSLLNSPAAMILNNTVITWQTDTADTVNHTVTARVRDSKGGADTLAWNITVTPLLSPPVITLDPQPQVIAVGQTATFGVIATGTKPFAYQWFKNDTLISGAADSSYTTPAATMSDSGALFKCIVSNSASSDTSAPAMLHVSITVIAPTITGEPQSIAVNEGQTATFGVVATGTKPFTYKWQKDSINIVGATDSSFTITATTINDSGSLYRCIVSNSAGADTSNYAVLSITIIWNKYPTYQQYTNRMKKFETDYPGICKLHDLGQSGMNTHRIYAIKISDNVNSDETEPEFLFISALHGEDVVPYVFSLHMIDTILTNYTSDSRIKNLVDNMEIWITPLSNPDGMYKGGDTTVAGAQRNNIADDFDLNRNFPCPCMQGNHQYYGEYTYLAKETEALINLIQQHKFVLSIDLNAGNEAVVWPLGSKSQRLPDDQWFQFMAQEYADTVHKICNNNGYFTSFGGDGMAHVNTEIFEAHGTIMDYLTYFRQCRTLTLVLSTNLQLNGSELITYWHYNKNSLFNHMEQVFYGINGTVTDSTTGQPLKAKVFVESHDADSSHVYSSALNGDYYRPIYAGTYNVTFSAPGYNSKTINNIVVENKKATKVDVELSP